MANPIVRQTRQNQTEFQPYEHSMTVISTDSKPWNLTSDILTAKCDVCSPRYENDSSPRDAEGLTSCSPGSLKHKSSFVTGVPPSHPVVMDDHWYWNTHDDLVIPHFQKPLDDHHSIGDIGNSKLLTSTGTKLRWSWPCPLRWGNGRQDRSPTCLNKRGPWGMAAPKRLQCPAQTSQNMVEFSGILISHLIFQIFPVKLQPSIYNFP